MDKQFESTIVAARRLFLHYKQVNNGKLDDQVRLTALRERAWTPGVEKVGLIGATERLLGLEINVSEFPPMRGADDPILATLLRYKNKADIYVSEQENFCWQRFYTAKELCHLLMDDGTEEQFVHQSADIIKLLDTLLHDGLPEEPYPAHTSELLAYSGACELLLPPEFTAKANQMLDRDSGDSLYQTALQFRVPKVLIETRFLNDNIRQRFERVYQTHAYKTVELRQVDFGPGRH